MGGATADRVQATFRVAETPPATGSTTIWSASREPDGPGVPLYQCDAGLSCSLGRCISPSCAVAERQASLTGCLFYTAQLDNVDSDDVQPSLILVTNTGDSMATIRLECVIGVDWSEVEFDEDDQERRESVIDNQHWRAAASVARWRGAW